MKLLKTLSILIIAAALGTSAYLAVSSSSKELPQPLGGDASLFIGGSVYTIAGSGITSSATSITLTSLTLPQNDYPIQDADLSDTFFVTIEPGNTSRQEFVSCTTVGANSGSAVTLSGCTRGLSPISPYTASSTLQFAHAGGSKLIFSNPPQLYNDAAFKNNDETITGQWDFSTVFPTISLNSGLPTTSTQIATKAYADNIANQGAATSSETVSGIAQLGTALEQASSTDNGANDPLVLQTKYATDTPQYGCAVGYTGTAGAACTVIADLTGKIKQAWIDLTESFTVTGAWLFQNTVSIVASVASPITLNGQALSFPDNDPTASSSPLINDGAGALSWGTAPIIDLNPYVNTTVTNTSTTTLKTIPIAANTVNATNKVLRLTANMIGRDGTGKCYMQFDFGNGTATTSLGYQGSGGTDNGVQMTSFITATSSASQFSTTVGHSAILVTGGTSNESSRSAIAYPTVDLTALSYLAISGSETDSATCALIGYSVELLSK